MIPEHSKQVKLPGSAKRGGASDWIVEKSKSAEGSKSWKIDSPEAREKGQKVAKDVNFVLNTKFAVDVSQESVIETRRWGRDFM